MPDRLPTRDDDEIPARSAADDAHTAMSATARYIPPWTTAAGGPDFLMMIKDSTP